MKILYSQQFKKKYKKLPLSIRIQFKERMSLFQDGNNHPILRDHRLHGEYAGYRSININGDYRAIYIKQSANSVIFDMIGTHSDLYS